MGKPSKALCSRGRLKQTRNYSSTVDLTIDSIVESAVKTTVKATAKTVDKIADPRHQRGLNSESIVRNYFIKRGFKILASRCDLPFAQVDLIVRSPQSKRTILVEVKSWGPEGGSPLSYKQLQRLSRARLYLQESLRSDVELILALVDRRGVVRLVTDIEG